MNLTLLNVLLTMGGVLFRLLIMNNLVSFETLGPYSAMDYILLGMHLIKLGGQQ